MELKKEGKMKKKLQEIKKVDSFGWENVHLIDFR
jgi:hypothetical protein